MENEEYLINVTDCGDKPEKQHSIVTEQKDQLTPAEIAQSNDHPWFDQEEPAEKEKDLMAVNESHCDKDETYEALPTIFCDENSTAVRGSKEIQKSIMSANALLVNNGKFGGNEIVTKTTNSQQNVSKATIMTSRNDDVGKDKGVILSEIRPNISTSLSLNNSPSSVRYADLTDEQHELNTNAETNNEKMKQEEQSFQQMLQFEQQLEQLNASLLQKDNMIALFQRENTLLEKEKDAFRKEKDLANKEKESAVIKFATKEKSLIDAKKEKDVVEKQLLEARKEIKNYTSKFQVFNEEKSRVTYLMDEKCNEVRKYQRECEKLKADYGHLESKLKYHMNKLNIETEAKLALEKKLEEERNSSNKLEEKANEKLKLEFEAQTILFKHEITNKSEKLDKVLKEAENQKDLIKHLQEQLNKEIQEKMQLQTSYTCLQEEHNHIQNSYTHEMLNSAKLRGQLEQLQVLKTQNTLNEDKIFSLSQELQETLQKLQDNEQDLQLLYAKEIELLSFNKEMSESIVDLQNQICLLKSQAQGTASENELLKKERLDYDSKFASLENQLKQEHAKKNEERVLLAKHLSEKTKLYENTKIKLENIMGDFEANKHKHITVVKELQRDIIKFKRAAERNAENHGSFICSRCQNPNQNNGYHSKESENKETTMEALDVKRSQSRQSSISATAGQSAVGSRRESESSESDTVNGREMDFKDDKGPSKKYLVERILRLQQASARQTEKIDFLEQHTLSLVAELQKKSKVVQYYMLRDQAGALTSSKSDENKSELAKYGTGVMSAIYSGIKGVENKSMSLELSLEINKKLQAVLEDTLLKNITLKENLDVLGLEVDNLTRKLRQLEASQ